MTFHLKCVHIILVRFRLLSGHLLGNSCSTRMTICSLGILNIFAITYFEVVFFFDWTKYLTYLLLKTNIYQIAMDLQERNPLQRFFRRP